MVTNTKENGFEKLIVYYLVDKNNYLPGNSTDFNKEFAIDELYLWNSLKATQLPAEVAKNEAYQNALKNSNSDTARIESNFALRKVILASMNSGLELFKQYQDNKSFQTWLQDYVFDATYNQVGIRIQQ